MEGRGASAALARSWRVGNAGCSRSALSRRCRRIRWSRRTRARTGSAEWTVTGEAETQGTTRTVIAGSALGAAPNPYQAAGVKRADGGSVRGRGGHRPGKQGTAAAERVELT